MSWNATTTTSPETAGQRLESIWQTLMDYRELTKPKIVHLLVVTTVCPMLVAHKGIPSWSLLLWTILGTALVCGSAQTINMVWDKDIDRIMERTRQRPIVQGRISPLNAMLFAGLIGFVGVMVLAWMVNPLAALMGIAGHAFYVIIYTMWLKRSTPQNIVIGGAAGAFPPLIGWAAVTGELSLTAWLIFGIIFLWTPPHFWALALYKNTDYDAAGVPMMPVVRGERTTKFQMMLYTSLLLGVTVLMGVVGLMGIVYLAAAILLGAGFVYTIIKCAFEEDGHTWAKRTFAYSIIYLALLFGAMSVDALVPTHFTEDRRLTSIEKEAERIRSHQTIQDLRERNGQALTTSQK